MSAYRNVVAWLLRGVAAAMLVLGLPTVAQTLSGARLGSDAGVEAFAIIGILSTPLIMLGVAETLAVLNKNGNAR